MDSIGALELSVIDLSGQTVFSTDINVVIFPTILSIEPNVMVRNPSQWFDQRPQIMNLGVNDQRMFSLFEVSLQIQNSSYRISNQSSPPSVEIQPSQHYFGSSEYAGSNQVWLAVPVSLVID